MKALAKALHEFQADAPPVHLDATNPRDEHRNPLSACPDCGNRKLRRAKRCRPCSDIARRGEVRTQTPSKSTGWRRAREARPIQRCEFPNCELDGMDRHHIDGDPLNNDITNIAVYCRRHHMTIDGRLAALAERGPRVGKSGGRPKREAA